MSIYKGNKLSSELNLSRQSSRLKKVAFALNYLFYLKLGAFQYGSIRPIISRGERAKLRALPRGAGNILFGPHPGNQDAHLLFHLFTQSRDDPVLFLMAAETYYRGTFLRRWLLNKLGVIPVNRGKSSPEIVQCMVDHICKGWWGGLFPEGDVYFSRDVMHMEIGFLRIAINSALIIQKKDKINGYLRPVFITPFAHVYFLKNTNLSLKRLKEAIEELEQRLGITIDMPSHDITDRLRAVGDKLLDQKALEYAISKEKWHHSDRFEKIRRLQNAILEALEVKYMEHVQTGFARRRAMKVRMICIDCLEDTSLSKIDSDEIEKDIVKIRELILMTPFSQAYRDKYGDLEMWVEYLRRIRTALALPKKNFGPEEVVFKILEPIDVHPIAKKYQTISSNTERKEFLIWKTEELRKIIQCGVDDICKQRSTPKLSD